jgi:hypothetical protein
MEGNSRPIEEIQEGDSVLTRSEFDPQGPLERKRVEEKFVRMAILNRSPVLLLSLLLLSRSAGPSHQDHRRTSILCTRSRTFCPGG